jgi:hypothetical protein
MSYIGDMKKHPLVAWSKKIRDEIYRRMFEEQGGVCAICKREATGKRRFAIDHNHKNGKIRGLLCYRCNLGLGSFEDDPFLMARAIAYLGTVDVEVRFPRDPSK